MLWKVARPQLWIISRRLRQLPRLVVPAIVVLVGLGGQWLYTHFLQDKLAILGSDQGIAAVASFLPSLFFVFVFSAVLGLADILYQLYLSSDLELLMVAPVPGSVTFAVKLILCSRATWLPAILSGGLLAALGLARGAGGAYYLLAGLILLGAMIAVTAAMMSLVIVAGRLIPPRRARSWLPVVLALLSMALIPLQTPIMAWISSQGGLLSFLNHALRELPQMMTLAASLAGMALLASLVAYAIFGRAFYDGWNRFQEVPSRRRGVRRSVPALVGRALPAPMGAMVTKEWLTFGRTPQSLLTLAQPLVLGTVVATLAVAGSTRIRPLVFWMLLMFLGLYLTFAGNPLQMAVATEGRNLAFLQCAPVRIRTIMRGKFWATWLLAVPVWSLVLIILGLLFRLPLWQTGLLIGIAIWGLTGASLAAGAVSALTMDFAVQDPRRRLPGPASWLIVALSLVFGLLTIAGALWGTAHLFPQSDLALQLRSLGGLRIIGALVSESYWPPLLMVGGQLAFGLGMRGLWLAGMHRLERYEEV